MVVRTRCRGNGEGAALPALSLGFALRLTPLRRFDIDLAVHAGLIGQALGFLDQLREEEVAFAGSGVPCA